MWLGLVEMKTWMRLPVGVADRLPRAVDVGERVRESAGDDRPADGAGDRLDGLEVPVAGDREAGLDEVDAEARQLLGDLELLGRRRARCPATARRPAASCRR